MKKLSFLADDIRLSFHWHYIGRLRRKAVMMLDSGVSCSHPALVECSNKILTHGMAVSKIWKRQKEHMPHYLEVNIDMDDNELAETRTIIA